VRRGSFRVLGARRRLRTLVNPDRDVTDVDIAYDDMGNMLEKGNPGGGADGSLSTTPSAVW
jgi:hypothetical protein